jgi:hypothetical protein
MTVLPCYAPLFDVQVNIEIETTCSIIGGDAPVNAVAAPLVVVVETVIMGVGIFGFTRANGLTTHTQHGSTRRCTSYHRPFDLLDIQQSMQKGSLPHIS